MTNSFGLIGGSSFGRPNIGWNNSSSMNRSKQRAVTDKRSAGRMGGKNFHQLPGSPMYSGASPKSKDRVSYGFRDASLEAKGSFSDNLKATRLHKFNKTNKTENGGGKSMQKSKSRGKYSSHGGGNNHNNSGSFSFDKSVNNGISSLQLPLSQNKMGGGAHLQSLELPPSTNGNGKLFIKNISLKPTGLDLPNSDVFNFFKTRIFPAYVTMLQERVNYKIDIVEEDFQQWFFNIQEALNVWFYVNSVLSYYDSNPAGNEGMSAMRTNISSDALNLYDQLGKVLETKVMDPTMIDLIRYFNDIYQVSQTNPQSALIKFSYDSTMGENNVALIASLEESINNLSKLELLKVNSLMKKAKPEWAIRLNGYDGRAKYDENFLTFWANMPEMYVKDGLVYMKPYLKTVDGAFGEGAHFGIYGNDYSYILSGLTCFNVSQNGQVKQDATTDTVHTGFIQPILFNQLNTSSVRWSTEDGQFVPAGEGTSVDTQFENILSNPSNLVVGFNGGIAAGAYAALKPQCQEPITMNVVSTRQDFNSTMNTLFNWTKL